MSRFFFCLVLVLSLSTCDFEQKQHTLKVLDSSASCLTYCIVDSKGERIDIPDQLEEILVCPNMLDITDNILSYMRNNDVYIYDLINRNEIKLFSCFESLDGISGPVWDSNKSRLMFLLIDQEKENDYREMTRLISVDLNAELKPIAKSKFDVPVAFYCTNICSSEPYETFKYGDRSILYKERDVNGDLKATYQKIDLN